MKETPTDPSLTAKPLQIEFPIPKITNLRQSYTYTYREREIDLFVSSCT
jgi:hypothetical protein